MSEYDPTKRCEARHPRYPNVRCEVFGTNRCWRSHYGFIHGKTKMHVTFWDEN